MKEKYKPSHLEKPSVHGQTWQFAIIVEEDYVAGIEDLIATSLFSPTEDWLRNGDHIFLRFFFLDWFLLLTSLVLVLFENFIDDICFFVHWCNLLLFFKQKIISVFQCIFSPAFELLLDDGPLLLALTFQHDLQQFFIFLLVPWPLFDLWVKIATPMFPTLLGSPVDLLL